MAMTVRVTTTLVLAVNPQTFHQTVCPRLAWTGSKAAILSSSLTLPVVAKAGKMNVLAARPKRIVVGRTAA